MIRICSSLQANGYEVTLVGLKKRSSKNLQQQPFRQKRLGMFFQKGFGFYAEYNTRLFFFLLFAKFDCICAIDLDTIIPCYKVSAFRKKKRVYDAHEYFTQQKEIISRPKIFKYWNRIAEKYIPKFKNGYTVGQCIADEFEKIYGVKYDVVRNLPLQKSFTSFNKEKQVIYTGAVNEARGFETLIPAMKNVNTELLVYGNGNFMQQAKELVTANALENRIIFKGMVSPAVLESVTPKAYIGINLVENNGLNQYYSLANKFFDYIQYRVPQVTMNFPEYKKINDEYGIAWLLDDLQPATIAAALNKLLSDEELYKKMESNCEKAAAILCWENEEKILLNFYQNIL